MTDKKLPIATSERGDNTYAVPCDIYQGRRHYAVCLRIISKKNSGEPHEWEDDCNDAVVKGTCPAAKLRREEEKAGHSLYYVKRDETRFAPLKNDEEIFSRSYQRGWGALDKVKRNSGAPAEPATPKPRKSKPKKSAGSTHADLVNKLIEEESGAE